MTYGIQNRKEVNPRKLFCVLGGGLVQDDSGEWHTVEYAKGGDKFGFSNDRWRVLAAAVHWKKNPDCMMLVSGGRGQYRSIKGVPTIASVIKSELIEIGVPEASIVIEDNSDNTHEQLIKVVEVAKKNNFRDIVLLTSEWHIPRVEAFLNSESYLSKETGNLTITTVSAEEILKKDDPYKWSEIIEEVKQRDDYKERVKIELKGVEDIEKGVYGKY